MNKISPRSANQLYEIIQLLPEYSKEKIPISIINLLKDKKLDTGEITISTIEHINNDALLDETKKYLSYIFLNYLASEDERKEFNQILEENENKYQKTLKEKYNPDNIFNNGKSIENDIKLDEIKLEEISLEKNNNLIKVEEKNFWSKIIKRIKEIIKSKKI